MVFIANAMVFIISEESTQNRLHPSIFLVFLSIIAFRKPSVSLINRALGILFTGNLATAISKPFSLASASLRPIRESGGFMNTV